MDAADRSDPFIEQCNAAALARRADAAEAARPRQGLFNAETGERVCLDCQDPIPAARIAANPSAVRCTFCEDIVERRRP